LLHGFLQHFLQARRQSAPQDFRDPRPLP
jgi:hypothetical protein